MNCFDEGQLQQYLDHECGPEEQQAIQKHLETCSLCRNALENQDHRRRQLKQSLHMLLTPPPDIPEFKPPSGIRTHRRRPAMQYLWPLAVAASLLLIVLLRPWFQTGKPTANSQDVPFLVAGELDANKPVTDYPLTITVVAPDGSISQTIIN